jgi:hypothetical protein
MKFNKPQQKLYDQLENGKVNFAEVSNENEPVLETWTCGKFYGLGSLWKLRTKDGEVDLQKGDKVMKDGENFIAFGLRQLKPERSYA